MIPVRTEIWAKTEDGVEREAHVEVGPGEIVTCSYELLAQMLGALGWEKGPEAPGAAGIDRKETPDLRDAGRAKLREAAALLLPEQGRWGG